MSVKIKPQVWSASNFSLFYQCIMQHRGQENSGHDHIIKVNSIYIDTLKTSSHYFYVRCTCRGAAKEN